MPVVNMHEAKTHLSKLVARANAGETIILGKAGTAQARLMPLEPDFPTKQREFGQLRGLYKRPDDIKTAFKGEIEQMFYGGADRGE